MCLQTIFDVRPREHVLIATSTTTTTSKQTNKQKRACRRYILLRCAFDWVSCLLYSVPHYAHSFFSFFGGWGGERQAKHRVKAIVHEHGFISLVVSAKIRRLAHKKRKQFGDGGNVWCLKLRIVAWIIRSMHYRCAPQEMSASSMWETALVLDPFKGCPTKMSCSSMYVLGYTFFRPLQISIARGMQNTYFRPGKMVHYRRSSWSTW